MSSYTKEKLEYLNATKGLIRDAIREQGQPVQDTDTFRSYADKILDIAVGEGKPIVYNRGQLSSGYSTSAIITHNLGVVPDLFIVYWTNMRVMPTDIQPCLLAFGYSLSFLQAHDNAYGGYLVYNPSNLALVGLANTKPIDGATGFIHSANATTVAFDPDSMGYKMDSATGYGWIAIGGLT